ncbi:hypothetical protein L195_g039992, partial [Trifolium pratense]
DTSWMNGNCSIIEGEAMTLIYAMRKVESEDLDFLPCNPHGKGKDLFPILAPLCSVPLPCIIRYYHLRGSTKSQVQNKMK